MADNDPKGLPSDDATLTVNASESPEAAAAKVKEVKETVEALKRGFTVDFGHPTIENTFTPDNIVKFFTGEINQAELLGITHEDMLAFQQYAYQQYQAGRFNDAMRIFAGLVTMDPGNSYTHAMLGACLQMLDEKDKAQKQYSLAIEIDSGNLQARVNRADLYLQQNKYGEALEDLKQVVALDPTGKDPATMRARALAAATAQALAGVIDMMKKQPKK